MKMTWDDLTETEKSLIAEKRAAEAAKKASAERRKKILRLAFEYEVWLQTTDEVDCSAAFDERFGSDAGHGIYHSVQLVRASVTQGDIL